MGRGGVFCAAILFAAQASAEPSVSAPALSLKVAPAAGGRWRMQITNTGELPVRVAADPRLLVLELTPAADPSAKKAPAPLRCILPDDARPPNDEGSELVIPANRSWSAVVDPLFYCFGAKERALLATSGTTVKPIFGWPIKPPAKNAKATDPRPPFAAAPVGAAVGKLASIKALEADAFTLSESSLVTAAAPLPARSDADPNVTLTTPEALDVARGIEMSTTITLTNGNPRPITLLFRPEMFLFTVSGERGSVSCGYTRQVSAPIRELFATIGAKGRAETSVLFSNICPSGTFDAPGLYRVTARLDTTGASGEPIRLKSWDGIAVSTRPLLVRVRSPRHVTRGVPRPSLD